MIGYFKKVLKQFQMPHDSNNKVSNNCNASESRKFITLSSDIYKNTDTIKKLMGYSSDIVFREFTIPLLAEENSGVIIYITGLTDKVSVEQTILKPAINQPPINAAETAKDKESIIAKYVHEIKKSVSSSGTIDESNNIYEIIEKCLTGNIVMLLDKYPGALIIDNKKYETRSIAESQTETVVRGPRESFTESLPKNLPLLRRKIHNRNLIIKNMTLGNETKTDVSIAYIKNTALPGLVEEVQRRLKKIQLDSILESGYIEQLIEDAPYSVFSTIGNTEKPDILAAKILDGRVGILVDGTPTALTVPMVFTESFQIAEDYYSRPYYVSLVRMLRYLSFILSITAPAFYVAFSTFHQELIPQALLLSMIQSREGTPFPAVFEALGMTIVYEILREAGIRLPKAVGQAISIVGALVIGQAAVSAGLIGAPMVIVISITAISSYAVPPQLDASSIIKFALIILAGMLGAYGMLLGLLFVLIHLCSLKSFGTPYFYPLAPLNPKGALDTFFRSPLRFMFMRSHKENNPPIKNTKFTIDDDRD